MYFVSSQDILNVGWYTCCTDHCIFKYLCNVVPFNQVLEYVLASRPPLGMKFQVDERVYILTTSLEVSHGGMTQLRTMVTYCSSSHLRFFQIEILEMWGMRLVSTPVA